MYIIKITKDDMVRYITDSGAATTMTVQAELFTAGQLWDACLATEDMWPEWAVSSVEIISLQERVNALANL